VNVTETIKRDEDDLPPGYRGLNDPELAEAKRIEAMHARQKESDLLQRDAEMNKAINRLQDGGVM
jgi:hypothetical protein